MNGKYLVGAVVEAINKGDRSCDRYYVCVPGSYFCL